jgi:triosephosphate isomerase
MKKLVVGNWKMYGSIDYLKSLLGEMDDSSNVIIAPPSVFLSESFHLVRDSGVQLAAQDCSIISGISANTGEVSSDILSSIGCMYVILGHSERRVNFEETDSIVRRKLCNSIDSGLIPILCVSSIEHIPFDLCQRNRILLAYEPVFSIGAKASPISKIEEFVKSVKLTLEDARIIYGGGVNPSNSSEILGIEDLDGVIVGGASVKQDEFLQIVHSANSAS